jgi:threonine/homoserine/homoserine lactone efflux protein
LTLSFIYQTIVQTIAIVLLLTFSFGPAFFALINTGIKYGYRTGSLLALGVVLSDFLLCLLIIWLVSVGATSLLHGEKTQRFMGILAGLVLVAFGVAHFRAPVPENASTIEITAPSTHSMIIKGFLLNSLNPAVWLLWLGNVTAVSKTMAYSMEKMVVYFGVTLGLVLLVELAKVKAANKLKRVLTLRTMYIVNLITGGLLVAFGVVLIYNHYFETT